MNAKFDIGDLVEVISNGYRFRIRSLGYYVKEDVLQMGTGYLVQVSYTGFVYSEKEDVDTWFFRERDLRRIDGKEDDDTLDPALERFIDALPPIKETETA